MDEPEAAAYIRMLERGGQSRHFRRYDGGSTDRCGPAECREEMARLIDGLGLEIVTVTAASARRIAEAYGRWGKGAHPAALNFGDCFAYAVAHERGCRLLDVGENFARTDVQGAL